MALVYSLNFMTGVNKWLDRHTIYATWSIKKIRNKSAAVKILQSKQKCVYKIDMHTHKDNLMLSPLQIGDLKNERTLFLVRIAGFKKTTRYKVTWHCTEKTSYMGVNLWNIRNLCGGSPVQVVMNYGFYVTYLDESQL